MIKEIRGTEVIYGDKDDMQSSFEKACSTIDKVLDIGESRVVVSVDDNECAKMLIDKYGDKIVVENTRGDKVGILDAFENNKPTEDVNKALEDVANFRISDIPGFDTLNMYSKQVQEYYESKLGEDIEDVDASDGSIGAVFVASGIADDIINASSHTSMAIFMTLIETLLGIWEDKLPAREYKYFANLFLSSLLDVFENSGAIDCKDVMDSEA